MERSYRPLIEVLGEVPDPRSRRGRRYPWPALLGLACAAVLCGYRSYSAMAEWARTYDPGLVRALGFTRATAPCAATFFLLFRALDRDAFEQVLGRWAATVLADGGPTDALALGGKARRGSRRQGAPGTHLLSVVGRTVGLTLAPAAVDDKTNEIPLTPPVLRTLVLTGRVVTMDALLTQREVAQAILDGGGDYLMIAKGNQPPVGQDIAAVFTTPPSTPSSARRRRSTRRTAGANTAA